MTTHTNPSTAPAIDAVARHNLSVALQALAQVGQTAIARHLNLSASTVSRIKSERLEEVLTVLAACGLKVVPLDSGGDYSEFIDAALVFAAYGLKAIRQDHRILLEELADS